MAKLGVRISCYEHGTTLLTLCFQAQDSLTGFQMQGAFRVVRRKTGEADKVLPTEMDFRTYGFMQAFSWQFIDNDVPSSGDWDYIAQFKQGGTVAGEFEEMQLSAVHYKR